MRRRKMPMVMMAIAKHSSVRNRNVVMERLTQM